MLIPVASDATIDAIATMAERARLEHVHMLAWRDLDDDEAGGSEVHADQVASIWSQAGLRVTMRTSAALGQSATRVRNGYTVSRKGGRYGVFARSPASQLSGRLGPTDGLVEIWNGMPFWSPLWWRGPRAIWLHHVHGPMWTQTLGERVGALGITLEEKIAPQIYRHQPMVTLSPSSRAEMVDDLGFDPDRVAVVPPGVDPFFSPGGQRSPTPLAVAVGRLAPVKDFPRLVRLMAAVREKVADVELVIVGEGYERDRLLAEIERLDAQRWIRLAGRISDDELRSLYRRSWMAVSTSTREGWGMTLTEAAACATPTVATDIAGHADAVDEGRSGLLRTTDADLVRAMVDVLSDATLRAQLQRGALERAAELTWEHTAIATFEVLADDAVQRRGLRRT